LKSAFQLDKARDWVFHPVMAWEASFSVAALGGPIRFAAARAAGCLSVCSLVLGCSLSPVGKHTAAFSNATSTVIDNSEDAYRAAIKLRHDEQVVAAVYAYDEDPNWSPYKDMKPLLTPEQLAARITVLDGLKAYASSLVELTGKRSDKDTAELDTSAAGIGTNLKALNETAAIDLSGAIPSAPVMNTPTANGVSTAVVALADYLTARKVKGSLQKVTQEMNQNILTLCELLNSDITILRRQADVDYQALLTDQDQFIRHAGTALNPIQHRDEVGTLIDLAAQQAANDALLAKIQTALHTLATTHQALTAAAQGNDRDSIHQKIAELSAAGQDLGNFYKSLPKS
jgi:hypothetical protein